MKDHFINMSCANCTSVVHLFDLFVFSDETFSHVKRTEAMFAIAKFAL